jgi:hypothetical protein
MKKRLLLTLLPFIQSKRTPCTLHQCDVNHISLNIEDKIETIELFNIEVDDYHHVCQVLGRAKTIEVEHEEQALQHQVYLVVDDSLLQKDLLAQGYAHLKIANPTYTYGQEMIEASRHIRQTNGESKQLFQQEHATVAIIYWLIVMVMWVICIVSLKKHKLSK